MDLFIFVSLIFLQYSCAQFTVQEYFSNSSCSGPPVYYVATSTSSCNPSHCISYSSLSISTSCPNENSLPTPPDNLIPFYYWFFSSSCDGTPSEVIGYSKECSFIPYSGYGYAFCSADNFTVLSGCSSGCQSECSSTNFSTACQAYASGSFSIACRTSAITVTSTASSFLYFTMDTMQPLLIFLLWSLLYNVITV